VLVSDTVGFIRDLPHELVEAFNATLLEVRQSDLILHVEDASDPDCAGHRAQVESVLAAIGASEIPKINVFNKIDLTDDAPGLLGGNGERAAVRLSARSRRGINLLKQAVRDELAPRRRAWQLRVPASAPDLRAFLYDNGSVLSERYDPAEGWTLQFELGERALRRLQKRFGCVALRAPDLRA